MLVLLLHTEDSSVYERDKERRYNNNEEWGDAKEGSHCVQIPLNEPIGIDSGVLRLTYCHTVGIIPLVMSCLPHEIVCCL